MPVTAKLSKRFYDALGDQVTNELVDWFNSVDATYRTELRELNELNFARFDAKLEQRIAEVRADLGAKIEKLTPEFDKKLADLRVELVRWMLAFWLGTMTVTLATLIAVILK